MKLVSESGNGAIVYLRGHEGRGIGLGHKMRAYALQDEGMDTVDANVALGLPIDSREYGIGAQIISDLGITKMRLLTNNPAKYGGLDGYHLEIIERVPLIGGTTDENIRYLQTKGERLGHFLSVEDGVTAEESE
jgi:3,4-dihydroxy 2-butanone 4-phosphate synthase/GTP cyclohydrolase II